VGVASDTGGAVVVAALWFEGLAVVAVGCTAVGVACDVSQPEINIDKITRG